MMEMKDYISMLVGLVVGAAGLLPLLYTKANIGPSWFNFFGSIPSTALVYIVAGLGFYLAIESIIEITNSNAVGWWSFIIAVAILALGLLKILGPAGTGTIGFDLPLPLTPIVYQIIFIIEGLFLMIAGFAMEI